MGNINLQFIEEVKNGDGKAFEVVRKLCYSTVYDYAKDNDISQDLVSEALEKIIKAIKRYNPKSGRGTIESNFRRWIKRICVNIWLDYRERKKREITFSELACALNISDDDRAVIEKNFSSLEELLNMKVYQRFPCTNNPEWNMAVREVISVFGRIRDSRKRVAVVLKYFYGMTTKEISVLMKENFDSIQTTIHRCRKELKNEFIEKGIDAAYLDSDYWRKNVVLH
jgi:RNA polymerase sigma factor (sigma-70 family)